MRKARRRDALGGRSHVIGLAATVAGLLFMAMLVAFGIIAGSDAMVYLGIATGIGVLPILFAVIRRRGFDLFEPINIVAASIFFGTTARAFYLVLSPERPQAQYLMMGQQFADINREILWVFAGVLSFCIGYAMTRSRVRLGRTLSVVPRYWRATAVYTACLALSFFGCVAYVMRYGIDLGSVLAQSQKRSVEMIADGEVVYYTAWEQMVAVSGLLAALTLAASLIARSFRPTPRMILLLAGLVVCGSFVPVAGQSRTTIIAFVFSLLVVAYYYRRVKARHIVLSLLAVLAFVAAMGDLRNTNSRMDRQEGWVDTTIGSGNGFDAVRTTAIMARVPERMDYLYGASYASAALFWVPRAAWPGKPPISLGPIVKKRLFGVETRRNGWPPGLVAEAYMNLGYLGVLWLTFLTGAAMRVFYESFRPLLGVSLMATVIYASVLYRVGFSIVSVNFAHGVTTALLAAIPVYLLMRLSGMRKRSHHAPAVARS